MICCEQCDSVSESLFYLADPQSGMLFRYCPDCWIAANCVALGCVLKDKEARQAKARFDSQMDRLNKPFDLNDFFSPDELEEMRIPGNTKVVIKKARRSKKNIDLTNPEAWGEVKDGGEDTRKGKKKMVKITKEIK